MLDKTLPPLAFLHLTRSFSSLPDVRPYELDVLRDVGLGAADARDALLDVVQEALRQRRVLVQVHQVGRLERRREGAGVKIR